MSWCFAAEQNLVSWWLATEQNLVSCGLAVEQNLVFWWSPLEQNLVFWWLAAMNLASLRWAAMDLVTGRPVVQNMSWGLAT